MKTLELEQELNLHGIPYVVKKIFSDSNYFLHSPIELNDEIFQKLRIPDKIKWCNQFYKCDSGAFPYAPDLESLTRCVEALINYPKPIKSWSDFIDIYSEHYKTHDLSSSNLPLSVLIERGLETVSEELLKLIK